MQVEKIETEKSSETHENGSANGVAVAVTPEGPEVEGQYHLGFLLFFLNLC